VSAHARAEISKRSVISGKKRDIDPPQRLGNPRLVRKKLRAPSMVQ
jgi:hypothetical protein